MSFARRSHHRRVEGLILLGLGDLYAEVEDYESAVFAYQEAELVAREYPGSFLEIYLILARANLAVLQTRPDLARQILEDSRETLEASPSLYELGLRAIINGRIYLLEGRPEKAIAPLEEAKETFLGDGRMIETLCARVWLAAAFCSVGQIEPAREELRCFLDGSTGSPHTMLFLLHHAGRWLAVLEKDTHMSRRLRVALEKVQHFEVRIPSLRRALRREVRSLPIPAPRLVIRSFGPVQVCVDGRQIRLQDWKTQSVRELFFFFLLQKRPLAREQIGEMLWPEVSEPSKLKLRFKNELYRLRRAVGQDVILFDGETYQFNQSIDYEYDVEAFEAHLARASSTETPEEKIRLYSRAIELVHGPFLEDFSATWAWPERERLNRAFISALLTLAELRQDAGEPNQALEACQQALESDPACEAAYRRMMQVYHQMGDRQSGRQLFATCEKMLRSTFGLPPSDETRQLYRDLIA